ncbi:hypothetical protein JRI60_02410 [Archangium violaceum]|uniref:hypothetical protein n=1 Tax=Archangium violaceum TaxID=83451 RepID=UPI00194E9FA1|nr:hypothetical protein [Archangium violaceum]QRN97955.1 hypothetical protein JRI60_02410 [Archangium violaceum]
MDPRTAGDDEFLESVETTKWPGEHFGHREHVRLGWLYLRREGPEAGYERLRSTIQRYAAALGAAGKYHETVTRAWSAHVYGALKETPTLEPFEAFLKAHPELLNGRLLERHYRKETLDSEAARREWVTPDVSPLPGFP